VLERTIHRSAGTVPTGLEWTADGSIFRFSV